LKWHKKELFLPSLLATFNMMVLINVFWAWVFVQFVHYHSQYTPLSPDDYVFELATKEDFQKLSDPSATEFKLSDGRYFVKSPAWHELNMPKYYAPARDGQWYVQVTTKGTAHFARRWTENIFFVLMAAIPASLLSLWNIRTVIRNSKLSIQKTD
jgi:hypothetical protein